MELPVIWWINLYLDIRHKLLWYPWVCSYIKIISATIIVNLNKRKTRELLTSDRRYLNPCHWIPRWLKLETGVDGVLPSGLLIWASLNSLVRKFNEAWKNQYCFIGKQGCTKICNSCSCWDNQQKIGVEQVIKIREIL